MMHLIKILNNQNRVQDRACHNSNTEPRDHRRILIKTSVGAYQNTILL